jgi:hypothetical protein
MKKRLIILLAIIILLFGALVALVLIGVRLGGGNPFTPEQPTYDYNAFVEQSRQIKGAENVNTIDESPNDILSVQPKRISIGEDQLDVFEFSSANDAASEAKKVSSDGSQIDGYGSIDWGESPHFYRKGKIIVFYVGDNSQTLEVLRQVFGAQFAGK